TAGINNRLPGLAFPNESPVCGSNILTIFSGDWRCHTWASLSAPGGGHGAKISGPAIQNPRPWPAKKTRFPSDGPPLSGWACGPQIVMKIRGFSTVHHRRRGGFYKKGSNPTVFTLSTTVRSIDVTYMHFAAGTETYVKRSHRKLWA